MVAAKSTNPTEIDQSTLLKRPLNRQIHLRILSHRMFYQSGHNTLVYDRSIAQHRIGTVLALHRRSLQLKVF